MKPLKFGLRVWITIASILSFAGGWAFISHAGKPAPFFSSQSAVSEPPAIPTLQPVPPLDNLITNNNNGSSSLQPLTVQPNVNVQQFFPRMRTRGS
jgi:hypothetical protein